MTNTDTTTYTLHLEGWQVTLAVVFIVGVVWAVRAWRAGVRPSDFLGRGRA